MISKAMVLPILSGFSMFALPAQMSSIKYIPIYSALTIQANKKLPPYAAYSDSHNEGLSLEWKDTAKSRQHLLAGVPSVTQIGPYVLTQKRFLETLTIRSGSAPFFDSEGGRNKTATQIREENQGPQWLKNVVSMPTGSSSKVVVDMTDLRMPKRVAGHVELREGLAVTNEHHIEVRRSDEGVFREVGKVDLDKGYYSVDVEDTSGTISARLVDKSGTVLGEGSVRPGGSPSEGRLVYGPVLEISPPEYPSVIVGSYYPPPKEKSGPTVSAATKTTAMAGQMDLVADAHSGESKLKNVGPGSNTIIRARSPGHLASNKIMVVGRQRFNMTTFPNSMIEAMVNIVHDGGNQNIDLDQMTVVWGQVSIDGKPVSGISVQSETDPEAQAIYFNEFMIPDSRLTATSTNGIYAFINMQQGFNALLAQRGDAYFGHQNIEVELGSVAIGDIQSSLRTATVMIRAFDAFSGKPARVTANLQSVVQPVVIENGRASVVLTQVPRLSMAYTETGPDEISANYFYNDQDEYIHLPILRKDWMASLRGLSKVDEETNAATIVGFFGEENFEVYLAGQDKNSSAQVVYFDAAGNLSSRGVAGGGFVIFNVSPKTQEVVLIGLVTEKIYSKIVPADKDMTAVVTFVAQ